MDWAELPKPKKETVEEYLKKNKPTYLKTIQPWRYVFIRLKRNPGRKGRMS